MFLVLSQFSFRFFTNEALATAFATLAFVVVEDAPQILQGGVFYHKLWQLFTKHSYKNGQVLVL